MSTSRPEQEAVKRRQRATALHAFFIAPRSNRSTFEFSWRAGYAGCEKGIHSPALQRLGAARCERARRFEGPTLRDEARPTGIAPRTRRAARAHVPAGSSRFAA